jgi:AraC-like DNA-binding protein
MPTFFDTNDFPAAQRFAQWRDCAANLFLPVDVQSRDHDTFRYQSTRSAIDGIPLGTSTARDLQVQRARHHIGDPATCPVSIYIPTSGELGIAQATSERRLQAGEMMLVDAACPYDQEVLSDLRFVWMHVPRNRLPCRCGDGEALAGLMLASHNPYVRLAIDFIRSVVGVAEQLKGENARRIADQALDLIAMAVAHETGCAPPDGQVRRAAMLHYAKSFIDLHLADTGLSLEMVAAALKVSPRHLSGLFGDTATPYRTYVRERRLAQCARDLATPRFAHRSVFDIALSWGFVDLAHFSRCFKEQYGQSPSDYRAQWRDAAHLPEDQPAVHKVPGSDSG